MRWLTLVAALVVVLGGPPPAGGAQEAEGHLLATEGVINPFTERYLAEGLRAAERAGAAAVYAQALERVFAVARGVDSKTMSLQSLETLKALGTAESTKLLVPMEFTNLLRPFVDHSARAVTEPAAESRCGGRGESRREAA